MVKGDSAIVVDAQVPWESENLVLAALHKKAKYGKEPIHDVIRRRYRVSEIHHMPVIVGARGIWSKRANKEIEATLRISNKLKRQIVTDVIQWGVSIHRQFGRSTFWNSARPPR